MINCTYQLVSPRVFSVKYTDLDMGDGVVIRPKFMSICHADQRYYQGLRDASILKKKLPMALIHECCAEVVCDKTGLFKEGQMVVPIPNIPGSSRGPDEYENYAKGSKFLSSGYDGFMREFVQVPYDRLVLAEKILPQTAAICEFVSVGMHAVKRFNLCAHGYRNTIAVWGDGSLAFVVSCILKSKFKNSKIIVIGKNRNKLSYFSFVDETYLTDDLPEDFAPDHAFECVGGLGSYYAIDDIIRYINPQGTVILMGVSENRVEVNTRDVLEKGLTLVGCSRSGKSDFEDTIKFMQDQNFQRRLSSIIDNVGVVQSIEDIHTVFAKDTNNMFKTVFEWKM